VFLSSRIDPHTVYAVHLFLFHYFSISHWHRSPAPPSSALRRPAAGSSLVPQLAAQARPGAPNVCPRGQAHLHNRETATEATKYSISRPSPPLPLQSHYAWRVCAVSSASREMDCLLLPPPAPSASHRHHRHPMLHQEHEVPSRGATTAAKAHCRSCSPAHHHRSTCRVAHMQDERGPFEAGSPRVLLPRTHVGAPSSHVS